MRRSKRLNYNISERSCCKGCLKKDYSFKPALSVTKRRRLVFMEVEGLPEGSGAVAGWAKETWGTESVLYRFFGQSEEPAARGLVLQFGYLPEGLTEVRRTEGDSQQLYAFKNADGSRLMYLTVMTLAEGRQLQILADEKTVREYTAGGRTVTDYPGGDLDHTLVWFDESRGLASTMDCLLTLDDALRVVEALEY